MLLLVPFIYAYTSIKNKTYEVASKVINLGQMPTEIAESSGLETADAMNTFFTHSDHGNGTAVLYKINGEGALLKKYTIAGADSKDWEDIARDNKGNLYIADLGNNSGNRSDLKIYKVRADNPVSAETIAIAYDTKETVAAKGKKGKGKAKTAKSFNCEALLWHNGKLYMVTKGAEANLFEVSDAPGNHTAKLIGTKDVGFKITGADLSPNGAKLALMSLGRLHVFNVSGNNFFSGEPQTIELGNVGQTEGLVFTDDNTIVFSNEAGQLFSYNF